MKKLLSVFMVCGLLAASAASCAGSSEDTAADVPAAQEMTTEEVTAEDTAAFDKKAQEVAEDYMRAVVNDHSALKAAKVMFPEDIVLKSFTTEDIARSKLFDGLEMDNGVQAGGFKVDKCEPLTQSQLMDAEAYYEKYANVISGLPKIDYTVLDGREITLTTTLKGGDDSQEYTSTFVVVDMGDEGCKLITATISKLEGLAD